MTTTDSMKVWLDGITLQVADVERSLKFYQHFPGAILEHHRPKEFALLRLGQATRLGLLGSERPASTSRSPPTTSTRSTSNCAPESSPPGHPKTPTGESAPSTSSTPTATASSSPAAEISRTPIIGHSPKRSASGTAMCVTQWGMPAESSGCSAQCRRPSYDQWGMRRPLGTSGTRSACLHGGMSGRRRTEGRQPSACGSGCSRGLS